MPRPRASSLTAFRQSAATRSARRWPVVLVALLLEVVIGVPTQGPAAHAAVAGETYTYSIAAVDHPRSTLCVGEKVRYTVKVLARPTTGGSPVIEVPGVKVDASVIGGGAFVGTTGSGVNGTETGVDIDDPIGIQFSFKAGTKPGNTRLIFAATVKGDGIDNGQVSVSVPVRVIECRFLVTEYTSFPPNPIENPSIPYPRIIASTDIVLLTADINGHFTGSGGVRWIGSTLAGGGVSVTETFPSRSHVDITGEMSQDGKLSLKFVYQIATSNSVETVDGVTQSGFGLPYLLDPLEVTVDPHNSVTRKPHGYGLPGFLGKASIIVLTEKE
jgi:hypothetical protein